MLPAVLLILWERFIRKSVNQLNFKRIVLAILIPALFLGILGYVFVFGDYNDPRTLTDFEDIDRLFLPTLSPAPPLENYNLFSGAHIYDFFNAIIGWSAALIGLVLILFIKARKSIQWGKMALIALVVTLALFMSMLFMINPLFSLPMDWDLFCFPVIFLLVLTVRVVSQIENTNNVPVPLLSILGITLLTLPTFYISLAPQAQSLRIRAIGSHVYKTYYEHASTYLLYSLQNEPDLESYLRAKEEIYKDLRPFARKGIDKQYADLLLDDGINYLLIDDSLNARIKFNEALVYFPHSEIAKYQLGILGPAPVSTLSAMDKDYIELGKNALRKQQNPIQALAYFDSSKIAIQNDPARLILEMEANFVLKRYKKANQLADQLVDQAFPSLAKALRITVHVSLEAENYTRAAECATQLFKIDTSDHLMETVIDRIDKNDRISELKKLFSGS